MITFTKEMEDFCQVNNGNENVVLCVIVKSAENKMSHYKWIFNNNQICATCVNAFLNYRDCTTRLR